MALTTFERAVGIAGIIAAIAGVIAIVPKDWYTASDSPTEPTTSVMTATSNATPDTSPGWPPSPESPAPEVPVMSDSPSTPAPQPPVTTTDAPPPIPVVNRLDITTWAYNKTALNSYRADNNGGKSVRVDWTARADGHEIDGACASSARVQGPDTDQAKDSSNCSSSVWFDIHQPGNYTVTVTTHQDSGAEYSQNITLAIVP
ncbi:hypothetical protein [Mycolicibacterium chubuense]|uniref:hypothetical protein n=1 Tax=Mycolicibacterium chubuense TaxID=1800 RepID=UPI0013014340|nr:hypothetical protein [Mycolicibacterium chubuense]